MLAQSGQLVSDGSTYTHVECGTSLTIAKSPNPRRLTKNKQRVPVVQKSTPQVVNSDQSQTLAVQIPGQLQMEREIVRRFVQSCCTTLRAMTIFAGHNGLLTPCRRPRAVLKSSRDSARF
jgi:hypothetical protein